MNQQQRARKEVRDQVWAKVNGGFATRTLTLYGRKFWISVESEEKVTMKQPKRREINRIVKLVKRQQAKMLKIITQIQGGRKWYFDQ